MYAHVYLLGYKWVSHGPLVDIIIRRDERLIDPLYRKVATQYTILISKRIIHARQVDLTYHADATSESSSATTSSLLAPLTRPLWICVCSCLIFLEWPKPEYSSTLRPMQSE